MKKLEEILNLPDSKELISAEAESAKKKDKKYSSRNFKDISDFDKISQALPQVSGLGEMSDREFDELADRATNAYDDLMELGMNVEARFSARVFEVASTMLKNAIEAKNAKIDKKLKMIELQLKKQKLDMDSNKGSKKDKVEVQAEGFIVSDRNSLLNKLKNLK